jgi:SAM-dependent methyltransferase
MIDWDAEYRAGGVPWEIGGPQPALAPVLDEVRGPKILDLGCGTGELAVALARRGHDVTGVDISGVAVEQARARAAAAGLAVRFEVGDAARLSSPERYDAVFDSGLLHNLVRQGGSAADDYLALLPGLTAPGATVVVLAVSAAAGDGWGLTRDYLATAFAEPRWTGTRIDDIEVSARVDGDPFTMPGFLLRTVRP